MKLLERNRTLPFPRIPFCHFPFPIQQHKHSPIDSKTIFSRLRQNGRLTLFLLIVSLIFVTGCPPDPGPPKGPSISEVLVSLENGENKNIGGMKLTLQYDNTRVSYDEAISGAVSVQGSAKGGTILAHHVGSELKIGLLHQEGFRSGEILQILFKINGSDLPSLSSYEIVSLEAVDLMGSPLSGISQTLKITNR